MPLLYRKQGHTGILTFSRPKARNCWGPDYAEGLIRHLGVSNATAEQVGEAQAMAPIVCVQNIYNLAYRQDDQLIDTLADQGIAYVPFFPLGGFSPLQSAKLSRVAMRLDATPMAVALAR